MTQEIIHLRAANEEKSQRLTESNRQIAHEEGLSVKEGLHPAQQ